MNEFSVGLFNDSFPPAIDGVAQTVKNYAVHLSRRDCDVTVVTPKYKEAVDNYDFDVYRYPSIPTGNLIGYRAGIPFDPVTVRDLRNKKFDLMHIHAPFVSSVLVEVLNHRPRVPTVLTYHTKFDQDIEKRVPISSARKAVISFVRRNVNAVDEVWVVTGASVQALRDIGYEGECRVMENGTDFSKGAASPARVAALREQYGLREDVPTFLFVGRMMWYKNIKLILDSLKILHQGGLAFRAVFVGDGYDAPAIQEYASVCGLSEKTIFTGAVRDREQLRVFYSAADLFLFPSTYDTSGIVVKEAAACDCPSLLVRGSCASEGAVHNVSALLTEEDAQNCADVIAAACYKKGFLKEIGIRAGKDLYLSWEDAVGRAYDRYREILGRT